MRVWRLPDVSLSVAHIGPKSRTERPRKTEIGTEVGHFTRDANTTFKVKRSKVNLQGAGTYCGGLPRSLFWLWLTRIVLRDRWKRVTWYAAQTHVLLMRICHTVWMTLLCDIRCLATTLPSAPAVSQPASTGRPTTPSQQIRTSIVLSCSSDGLELNCMQTMWNCTLV